MKRFLASLSTATLLASPLSALAMMPGELLSKLSTMTAPSSTTLELHGHAEDVYFSVWASGSQAGTFMHPDAKAKWKATIDVVQGAMKVRAKVQLRMFQNTVYFKLDSIDGSVDDLLGTFSWELLQKPWARMALDDGTMTDMPTMESFMGDPMMLEMLNGFFDVTEDRFPGGKAYTLTPSMSFLAHMDMPPGARLDLKIRVNTTNDGIPNYAGITAIVEDPSEGLSMTLTAETQRSGDQVYVEVPKDAMSWEEMEWHLDSLMGGGAPMFPSFPMMDGEAWMPDVSDMPMEDDWNDEMESQPEWWMPGMDAKADEYWDPTMEDEWSSWPSLIEEEAPTWIGDDCDAEVGTPAYLYLMRKGACPNTGPGAGSRDEKYRSY